MTVLTFGQLRSLAASVGAQSPDVMAAIALAESGGNSEAHNANMATGDDSYGLWQINMIGSMGPSRRAALGLSSNSELFNPAVNARAMKWIQDSQGLKAWTTYTSGKYKKYMSTDNGSVQEQTVTPVGIDPGSWVQSLVGAIKDMGINVGVFILGLALVLIGIVILTKKSNVVENVVDKATS